MSAVDEAPRGTIASLGHPANDRLIIKGDDGWRDADTGVLIDPEDFRAGWLILTRPTTR